METKEKKPVVDGVDMSTSHTRDQLTRALEKKLVGHAEPKLLNEPS